VSCVGLQQSQQLQLCIVVVGLHPLNAMQRKE
jgi:hypothetical protein